MLRQTGKPGANSRHRRIASSPPKPHHAAVTKLCIFVGTTIGSYAGWALGEAFGLGFGWDFVISGAGSIAGVYAGWKVAQKLAE